MTLITEIQKYVKNANYKNLVPTKLIERYPKKGAYENRLLLFLHKGLHNGPA